MDGGHKKGSSRFSGKGRSGGGSRIARLPRRPPFRGGYSAAVGSLLASESPTAQGIRGQAERRPGRFPQQFRGGPVGGQLAGEFRPSGVGIFACQQASHSGFVADPWETSLLASSGPLVLGYSLASKLPTATSWQIRGRPACWRIPALWCWDIRLPASFPQRLRGMIRGRPACRRMANIAA